MVRLKDLSEFGHWCKETYLHSTMVRLKEQNMKPIIPYSRIYIPLWLD